MSEPDVIVWLDPGKTTGLAWYDLAAERFGASQHEGGDLIQALDALATAHPGRLAIGWELYLQTPRSKGTAKYSLGEIARVAALCEERGIPVLRGQPSSARMAKSTVVFLRRLGWYRPGLQHANDAACHLFRHLIRLRPVPQSIRRGLPPGY